MPNLTCSVPDHACITTAKLDTIKNRRILQNYIDIQIQNTDVAHTNVVTLRIPDTVL